MSDDELLDYPLKVTVKGDGAAPWITAAGRDGASTADLLNEVMKSGLMQAAAEASALLTGAVRVVNGFGTAGSSPPVGGHPSPGPQAASTPPAVPSYPQQPSGGAASAGSYPVQPQGGYNPTQYQVPPTPTTPPVQSFNGAPHPENLHCSQCGAPVIGKVIRNGSKLWTCPNQASKGDGHYTKWLD